MNTTKRIKLSPLILALLTALPVQGMAQEGPVVTDAVPEWNGQEKREKDLESLGWSGKTPVEGLFTDKRVSYTWKFGSGDAEGALRVYAEVKKTDQEAASETADDVADDLSDGSEKRSNLRKKKNEFQAAAGIEAEAILFGGTYKVAAVKIHTKAKADAKPQATDQSAQGRNRSNAVTSRQDIPSRNGRSRSNAVASSNEAGFDGSSSRKKRVSQALQDNLTIEIAGFTVKYKPGKDNDQGEMAPRNLLPVDLSTYVVLGPVPLNIRGNAGVGLEMGYEPSFDPELMRLGLSAEAGAYLHGWVSAGLGGGVAGMQIGAGLMATLNMMHTTVGAEMGVSPAGLGGKLTVSLEAVAIELMAFVKAKFKLGWFEISKFWSYTLASFTSGVQSWEWPLLGGTQ